MKTFINPEKISWENILARPVMNADNLQDLCKEIFNNISLGGDEAVNEYSLKFDGKEMIEYAIDEEAIRNEIDPELKKAIDRAADNIIKFHESQKESSTTIETSPGVSCWREIRPIEKVGLYIPGGTAPLFSTILMLALPAKIAGCEEIVICTPPDMEGKIPVPMVYAASLAGVKRIFGVGGIQAVAAMSLGTETIPRVFKIFGPGNQYVMSAKQYALNLGTAIDLPAGPSEVMVIADEKADPVFIAADLLSQAEHGEDSHVVLVTNSEKLLEAVEEEVDEQLSRLPRSGIAKQALEHSTMISLPSIDDCIDLSNVYAPEHLIIMVENAADLTSKIQNAGSVFLGSLTPESAGDYASGTNHTLPTNGNARGYSGVSLDSFIKKITFQEISEKGLTNLGPVIEIMAEAEELQAHKNAVSVRLKALKND